MKSTIVAFAIAAAVALLLVVVSAVSIRLACGSGAAPVTHTASPLHVDLRADARADALFTPALLQFTQAGPEGAPAPSWSRNFFCGVKASDLALVGFAIFLVLISIMQGQWMQRTAEASEMSGRIFHAAMIATQRAYVVFREFQVNVTRLSSIEDIQSCAVQPILENAGTTPTRNGRSHINWRYFDRAIPDDFDFSDYDESGTRVSSPDDHLPMIVGPRGLWFAPVVVIEGSTIRMVRELQGRLLIWGWAEYDDVFDTSRPHRTEFCYQMTVTGSSTNSHISFSQYPRFNGADEDCEREPTLVAER